MTVEYVNEDQKFAGGLLTKEGAEQVNAHRAHVGRGEKESVASRLKRASLKNGGRLEIQVEKAINSTPY